MSRQLNFDGVFVKCEFRVVLLKYSLGFSHRIPRDPYADSLTERDRRGCSHGGDQSMVADNRERDASAGRARHEQRVVRHESICERLVNVENNRPNVRVFQTGGSQRDAASEKERPAEPGIWCQSGLRNGQRRRMADKPVILQFVSREFNGIPKLNVPASTIQSGRGHHRDVIKSSRE